MRLVKHFFTSIKLAVMITEKSRAAPLVAAALL